MTRKVILPLGCAMAGAIGAALLCSVSFAQAQDYDRYGDSYYYERPAETVIVHPEYDVVEEHQRLGVVNGEINPVDTTISRPVSYSDLDLSRESDFQELADRIHDTAEDVCAELDSLHPALHDRDEERKCVESATRDALNQVR